MILHPTLCHNENPSSGQLEYTMSDNPNKTIVEKMWQALSDMDWEAMKACMHPEIH